MPELLGATARFWERLDRQQELTVRDVALCPSCGSVLEFPRDDLGRVYEQCTNSKCDNRFAHPLHPDFTRLTKREREAHGAQN